MDTSEAAVFTGLSISLMEKLRSRGGGPLFVLLGPGRRLGYRIEDLNRWIDELPRLDRLPEVSNVEAL